MAVNAVMEKAPHLINNAGVNQRWRERERGRESEQDGHLPSYSSFILLWLLKKVFYVIAVMMMQVTRQLREHFITCS